MRTVALPDPAYTIADQERMQAARRYFAWQARLASADLGRRVLEVGCGLGNFSAHLADRELVLGVDSDRGCISRWRARFAGYAHYTGLRMDVESPEFLDLAGYRPDSIACLNVLEHVEDDGRALRQMCEVLPPGGRVVLLVPAFEALYGEIDARLGHYRRYTKGTLARTANTAGFHVRRMRYMNAIGFFAWWANSHVFHRTEQSPAQIDLFDRFLVPLQSRVESWMEPPIGQSLLATLEKAGQNVVK